MDRALQAGEHVFHMASCWTGFTSEQVLIVRSDLNMSSGKIAAQCSHATLACYKALSVKNPSVRCVNTSVLLDDSPLSPFHSL